MKSNLFLFFVILLNYNITFSQVSADCSTAIPICGNVSSGGNVNGGGFDDFNGATGSGCLGTGGGGATTVESNSAWYTFTFQAAGQFGFNIDPNVNTEDWDFAVYGPFSTTTGNCGNSLGAPIRCNYSGSTINQAFTGVGINPVTNTQTGTYDAWMNVLPGQTYMLLVNNFSATNNGFTLNFTGSIFTANPNALDCSTACALSIGTDVDVCPGTTTILAANISNATSYVWSSTAAGFVNPGNVQSITVSVPGTYTVVVNKPGCNPNATASATVTIPAAPATGTPNNLTQCITNPIFNLNVNTPNQSNNNKPKI